MLTQILKMVISTLFLSSIHAIIITSMQQRGLISYSNSFYFYVKFDGNVSSLSKDYSVTLNINGDFCSDKPKIFSAEKTVILQCKYFKTYQIPRLQLTFHSKNGQNYIQKQKYSHQVPRNIQYINAQSVIQNYWQIMKIISHWIGYFLLFLFLINYLPYFLSLWRILQLTAVYLAFNINKPKILDIALLGVFSLNKPNLYQAAMTPQQNTILDQIGLNPVFVGDQYSAHMQFCFIMLGIFAIYLLASIILLICKNLALNYFFKRFIKDIFTNTAALYFMMHIPLGLTALIGFKYGNYIANKFNILQYIVNILGIMVFLVSPGLFSALLGMFKKDKTIFLKKSYLFSSRVRNQSQTFVFFCLLKDALFSTIIILMKVQFALSLMILYSIIEICVMTKLDVFQHRPILGLKLLEGVLLLVFTLFHLLFYLIQIGTVPRFSLQIMTILGYIVTGVLIFLYFVVSLQIVIQFIFDHCGKYCKRNRNQEIDHLPFTSKSERQQTNHNETDIVLKYQPSVRKEREKIMQRRLSQLTPEDLVAFSRQNTQKTVKWSEKQISNPIKNMIQKLKPVQNQNKNKQNKSQSQVPQPIQKTPVLKDKDRGVKRLNNVKSTKKIQQQQIFQEQQRRPQTENKAKYRIRRQPILQPMPLLKMSPILQSQQNDFQTKKKKTITFDKSIFNQQRDESYHEESGVETPNFENRKLNGRILTKFNRKDFNFRFKKNQQEDY